MARAKLAGVQDGFTFDEPIGEDAAYLKQQLITYIGNKRTLLGPIGEAVEAVRDRLGQPRLRILDAFSGSGVVARSFKRSATELIVNDIEAYSGVIGRCYLTNRCDYPEGAVSEAISRLNALVDCGEPVDGLFSRLYAPANEDAITPNDRVFYTRENARRLDGYRQLIGLERLEVRDWLLGPLLSEASIHANTAGVFKGFYKDTATGLGSFGGSGANALDRIRGQIRLSEPVLSAYDSQVEVFQEEANSLVSKVGDLDLAYFDPPYNQHPYGSNYFMLNLLVQYQEPTEVSRVSGIPVDWQRSGYNDKGAITSAHQRSGGANRRKVHCPLV